MTSNLFFLVSGEDERETVICDNRGARIVPSFLILSLLAKKERKLKCEFVIIRVGACCVGCRC